jgi:hypothetical protein
MTGLFPITAFASSICTIEGVDDAASLGTFTYEGKEYNVYNVVLDTSQYNAIAIEGNKYVTDVVPVVGEAASGTVIDTIEKPSETYNTGLDYYTTVSLSFTSEINSKLDDNMEHIGFFWVQNKRGKVSEVFGFLIIEWPEAAPVFVDKTALATAIASAPDPETDTLYYHEKDRYNGKKYIGVRSGQSHGDLRGSFWDDFQAVLETAKTVNENSNDQTKIDEAAAALSAAVDDLIPVTQVNATALYEDVTQWYEQFISEERNQPSGIRPGTYKRYLGDYTEESANAYRAALSEARAAIARLFDGIEADDPDLCDASAVPNEEYNKAENQAEVDAKLQPLEDAYLGFELYVPPVPFSIVPIDMFLNVEYKFVDPEDSPDYTDYTKDYTKWIYVILPKGYFESFAGGVDFAVTWDNTLETYDETTMIQKMEPTYNGYREGTNDGPADYNPETSICIDPVFGQWMTVFDATQRDEDARIEITSQTKWSDELQARGYYDIVTCAGPLQHLGSGDPDTERLYRVYFVEEGYDEEEPEEAPQIIESAQIANGQMMEDIKYPLIKNKFSRKTLAYDWIVNYGETQTEITINVPDGASVKVYDGAAGYPQTVTGGVCKLLLPASVDGVASSVEVTSGTGDKENYAFTCYTQNFSGMPSAVADYLCIASQYTNGRGLGPYGIAATSTLRGVNTLSNVSSKMTLSPVSLGNFGGYIVWEYDEPITDDPRNPYGVDFIVYGNSVDGGEGFAEPGSVLVSEDGETWYTLAGSLHYNDCAVWDYAVTYTKDSGGGAAWTDNKGGSNPDLSGGIGYLYPEKGFYPHHDWTEAAESSITLSGLYLKPAEGTNEYGNTVPPFPDFGYADVGMPGDSNAAANPYAGLTAQGKLDRTDGFDLKWAVDADGLPVDVSGKEFRYVKVQTATLIYNGAIGEKSTEVHMARTAAANAENVGVTDAPTSITVDGASVAVPSAEHGGVTDNVPVSGAFVVNVGAPQGANVYINSMRGASATFAKTPSHEMLRIIVQDGEKEPWIGYFNLVEGEPGEDMYTTVTFNPGSGVIAGDKVRTYMPEMPDADKTFPIPVREKHTFLGWFDSAGNQYAGYTEGLPRELTLTARWQYNLDPGEPSMLTASFRLIGSTLAELEDGDTIDLGNGDYKGAEYVTWIATKSYTLPAGSTVRDLFEMALTGAGLTWKNPGGDYISTISAPEEYGGYELSEFTNGSRSGWMYTLNGDHALFGVSNQRLSQGDEIIFHYVNDYAYEVHDWDKLGGEDFPALGDGTYWSKWLEAADETLASNEADVGEAKSAIESLSYTLSMATANTEAAVKAWIEAEIAKLDLNGVAADVVMNSFTPAAAATEANPGGTEGGFTFTVYLSKGEGEALASDSLQISGTVTVPLPGDIEEAKKVDDLIAKISDPVTLADEAKIEEARAAYNALSDPQKNLVTKLDQLKDAEAKLADLKEIKAVEDKIAAIGTVTLESKALIDEAREAYNALPTALANLVTNYQTLTAAEAALAQLLKPVQDAEKLIEELPAAISGSESDLLALLKASAAYDKLSDQEKAELAQKLQEKLLSLREEAAKINHSSNGVQISGLPWYIVLTAAPISGGADYEAMHKEAENKLGAGRSILGMYDITLQELTENGLVEYKLDGKTALLTITVPDLAKYKEIKIIHQLANGEYEYIEPTKIEGNKVSFEIKSLSKYAVIGELIQAEPQPTTPPGDENGKPSADGKQPKTDQTDAGSATGDHSNVPTIASFLLMALCACGYLYCRKRKAESL